MDDTPQSKEKKQDFETSLSTEEVIKLGTRPSPRHAPWLTALKSKHRLTKLTQHAKHESKTKFTLRGKKVYLAQPGIFRRTHHTEPDRNKLD
jgi:hypothetical protein